MWNIYGLWGGGNICENTHTQHNIYRWFPNQILLLVTEKGAVVAVSLILSQVGTLWIMLLVDTHWISGLLQNTLGIYLHQRGNSNIRKDARSPISPPL
jgi:hypothetical protein